MDALVCIRGADGTLLRDDPGMRPLYSISKTYIAACVHRLNIDLERPAADWLDSDWLPRGQDISISQLLNHTSGLRDYGARADYAEAIERGDPVWSDETFAEKTLQQPLLFEPGQSWNYSNPGYWVLKQIVERLSGKTFATLLQELILEPLDLVDTSVAVGIFADDLPHYPAGWVWHGLLLGSASDTARFLASPLIEPLRQNLTPVPLDHPQWQKPHYGHGLMAEPGVRFGHNGGGPGYSASCFHFEETGQTICALARGVAEDAAMGLVLDLNANPGGIERASSYRVP